MAEHTERKRLPIQGTSEEFSFGYKKPNFVKKEHPPNYTPPDSPSFVDVFKGHDGDNYLFKTWLLAKHAGLFTAMATLADITVGTQPKDITGGIRRLGYWGIPLVGGAVTYTSVVCVASSLRKKNDQWNHTIAGLAAGGIFGACRRSIMFGFCTGIVTAVMGTLYKESILLDIELWPELKNPGLGHAFSHKCDFTIGQNYPAGNWYTDPTPMPPGAPVPPACK